MRRVVIVGGVAGGATAATRLRRLSEEDEIVVLERGRDVCFSNCSLPYHLGGIVPDSRSLVMATPESLARRYRLDVRIGHEAVAIERAERVVRVRDAQGQMYELPYDKLILSPGAAPIVPPIPGIEEASVFTVRNVTDIERLAGFLRERPSSRVAVIGGGFIGIECAENLQKAGHRVTVIEALPQILAPLDDDMVPILHKTLVDHGVELVLGDKVTGMGAGSVTLASGRAVEADAVVMAVGVRPETDLAQSAGLAIGPSGAIAVDPNYRTSDPDIYAIGDAIEVFLPLAGKYGRLALAGPAHKQARAVADHIHGRPVRQPGFFGAFVIGVFDMTAASVGLNERSLRELGRPYGFVEVIPKDRVGIMPGAADLHLKLLYERPTGRVLGAQAIGRGDPVRRIDVIATAIRLGATVADLADLELCYSPPYGTAKDAVNHAGLVATNLLHGAFQQVSKRQVRALVESGAWILDVREPGEYEAGHLCGSHSIPWSSLRDRLDEIPRDRPIYVHCRTGQRSYQAVLVLQHHGFQDVYNIAGGFLGISYYEYFEDRRTGREPIVTDYLF